MDTKLLEGIGLTNSEAKVYVSLLELRSSPTGKIVERSGVASSKVYEILEKLINKGLASHVIIKGVKHFDAAPPKRILDYLKEKKEKILLQEKSIEEIIPRLESKRNFMKDLSRTEIFRGMKGLHSAFYGAIDDLTNHTKKEILSMGVPKRSQKVEDFFHNFIIQSNKIGIKLRVIFNESAIETDQMKLMGEKFEAKFMPESTPAAVNIIGDHSLIFMEDDEELLTIDIFNKHIANSFRVYFERLWNQEISIGYGFEEFDRVLTESLMRSGKKGEQRILGASFGKGSQLKVYEDFFNKFHEERINKKIPAKFLFPSDTRKSVEKLNDKYYNKVSQSKFLPYEASFPIETIIDPEQVHFAILDKVPQIISIKNKALAQNFKHQFDEIWNQKSKIVYGVDAIEDIFNDMLNYDHVDFIGARGYFLDKRPKFLKGWEKRAIEKKFTIRNIVNPEVKGHAITKLPFADTKYTLTKEFTDLSVFWIYGDKVVISNWGGKKPLAVIIEDKNYYDLYKKQFELLWKRESFTHKGKKAVYL